MGFGDVESLRRAGDRQSHELISSSIEHRFPDDAIRSEESTSHPLVDLRGRLWVVDPLDGTREFGEEGRTDFAVHVALVVSGRPEAGAVALPARSVVLSTAAPPHIPEPSGRLRLLVSRSRATPLVLGLAELMEADLVEMGSAGAKTMAVVLGEAEIYAHEGGQYEWDSAAPVAVALSAGLHCSRIDGTPLTYAHRDPWLPDLLVCRPELAAPTLDAIAQLAE